MDSNSTPYKQSDKLAIVVITQEEGPSPAEKRDLDQIKKMSRSRAPTRGRAGYAPLSQSIPAHQFGEPGRFVFCHNVDEFVPRTQHINWRMVWQPA